MNNLNIGFLASSVLAATGLGVYVYMNNNDNDDDKHVEHANNEYINDTEITDEADENDKYMKNNKKTVSIKTKRRLNKASGTRRKR